MRGEQLGGGERATCGAEVRVGQLRDGGVVSMSADGGDVEVACEEVRAGEREREHVGQLRHRGGGKGVWVARREALVGRRSGRREAGQASGAARELGRMWITFG